MNSGGCVQDNKGMYMSGSNQFTYGILTDLEVEKCPGQFEHE
jgi:hypothetical protein